MEITRDVILDLLPLYQAGEASADTCALVEEYLQSDPELAKMARQASTADLSEVPSPLTQEDEMEALKKANQTVLTRTLVLAAILAIVFLCTVLPGALVAWMFIARQ